MSSILDFKPANKGPAYVAPKTPFAATPAGTAVNFYKALPGEFGKAASGIGQGIVNSYISLGNTLIGAITGSEDRKVYQVPEHLQPLLGTKEIKDLPTQTRDLRDSIANSEIAKKLGIDKFAAPLAFGGVLAQAALDYSPFGGEKNVIKQFVKETDEAVVRSQLRQMGVPAHVADVFAPSLAKTTSEKEVRNALGVMKGLGVMEDAKKIKLPANVLKDTKSGSIPKMDLTPLSRRLEEYAASWTKGTGSLDKPGYAGRVFPEKFRSIATLTEEARKYPSAKEFVEAQRAELTNYKGDSGSIRKSLTDLFESTRDTATEGKAEAAPSPGDLSEGATKPGTPLLPSSAPTETVRPNVTLLSPQEAAQAAEFAASKRARERTAGQPPIPAKDTVVRQTPADKVADLVSKGPEAGSWQSLIRGYFEGKPQNAKANFLDYMGTPEFVLEKFGLAKGAELLQEAKDLRRKGLKEAIDKIQAWKKQLPGPESSLKLFRYLDGRARDTKIHMTEEESRIALEIKDYLKQWAKRLKLPEEHQISEYITHLFESGKVEKGQNPFDDPDLRLVMESTPAKSVYDPFLEKRVGKPGYKEDVWAALDAYVKRGTRKEAFDPALEKIEEQARKLPGAAYQYVTRLTHRINMRPTELDELVDNFITSTPIGTRFTERPTTVLSKKIRSMFYRGTLGLNVSSALRNLSQGANTYAKLGEKYTVYGYTKLFGRLITNNLKELYDSGVLEEAVIEDKKVGVYKSLLQKLDPLLFGLFDLAEKTNRGAAYFGAKARGLDKGLSLEEAEKYAKRIVRETQFAFGNVDSPVALSSDIVKTAFQLQSYSVKQIEFLTRMAKNKEFGGLVRYSLAGLTFVYSIGRLFGMTPVQLLPSIGLGAPSTTALTGLFGLLSPREEDRNKAISNLQRTAAAAIPGGVQARKTIQGLEAYNKGRDETPAGNFRFKIEQNLPNLIQAAVFGKSSLPEAQAYYDRLNGTKTSTPSVAL